MTDKEQEVIFCVKDEEHLFFKQLKDRVDDPPKGIDITEKYDLIVFRDGKAKIQVIHETNYGIKELNLFIIGNETAAIKERFKEFFKEATGHDLIFESLTKSEKEARREQQERKQHERQCQMKKESLKKQIMRSFSPLDFEILELRKKGKSIHGICRELGVTKGKVEYKLNRMALIPELMENVDKRFRPLTREERNKLQQTT